MKIITIVWIGIMVLSLLGCSANQANPLTNNKSLAVAATFYPLYDLAKSIVGDYGTVYSLVPAGAEPHDFEPKPSDIQQLNRADALVILGTGFAPFEDTFTESIIGQVQVISAGKGVSQIKTDPLEAASRLDPHIWLSPKNAKIMAANIINGLSMIDFENANYYVENGNNLIEQLEKLDVEYKQGLTNCKKEVILSSHNSFSYLGRDYGFRTKSISGLEPETEPTPNQIKQLINLAKAENIKYILYEELVDPRVAEAIASETGASLLELSPVEGTTNPADTYITIMQKNLQKLKLALECTT